MKRILFDENMPKKLRRELPEFSISTAQEKGWSAFGMESSSAAPLSNSTCS